MWLGELSELKPLITPYPPHRVFVDIHTHVQQEMSCDKEPIAGGSVSSDESDEPITGDESDASVTSDESDESGPFAACCRAAYFHDLAELRRLHESGREWNADTCATAASCKAIECLQYAHENGCPWDSNTCAAAATAGSIECLQYAHENGCPWDYHTCVRAIGAISWEGLNCLKYAHENGCAWDAPMDTPLLIGSGDCVRYATLHGFSIGNRPVQVLHDGLRPDVLERRYGH